jgi:hypothetical protein
MSTPGGLQLSRITTGAVLGYPASRVPGQPHRLIVGDPGRCPGQPSLTITIFDDSGSVAAPAGNDPVSNRYAEAAAAFDALARRCRCGHCLAAVLHFDLVAGAGPVPLKKRVPGVVQRTLAIPPQAAGCSLLGPSLAAAARMVEAVPSIRNLALVVFSDFQLFDPDPERVLADLAAFPGEVHAVALGSSPGITGLDPPITVTQLTSADSPGALGRALLRSLSRERRGARIRADPPTPG